MTDYKITITNASNLQKGEKLQSKTIIVRGDCWITNYNPNKEAGKNKKNITIDLSNNSTTIKKGTGTDFSGKLATADFNKDVFSLLLEIANCYDDDKDNGEDIILSNLDIEEFSKKSLATKGLKILKDLTSGVIRVITKPKEENNNKKEDNTNTLLRIDFGEKNLNQTNTTQVQPEKDAKNTETIKTINSSVVNVNSNNDTAIYTVKEKDSLEKIARSYKIFVWQLIDANPSIANKKFLNIGDKLIIPAPIPLKNKKDLSKTGQTFLEGLIEFESKGNGEYKPVNRFGYLGAYQMGKAALNDLGVYTESDGKYINDQKHKEWTGTFIKDNKFGITSVTDFLNSPEKQDKAIIRYMQLNWISITKNIDIDKYIDQTIAGVKITKLGLLAGSHLVGVGAIKEFLESGGTKIPKDKNGKSALDYMKAPKLSGNDVSDFVLR